MRVWKKRNGHALTVAIDASVVLAIILGEPYDNAVVAELTSAIISTVNAAEVYARAARDGIDPNIPTTLFETSGLDVVPLSLEQAAIAGKIISITRSGGLSLGDRCCLALAIDRKAEVITADRAWLAFAKPLGVSIRLIR
jgi:ribonuclease VapC